MITARVLALGHPDDRREVARRFRLDESALAERALLVMGLPSTDADRIAGRVRQAGHHAAAAPGDATADLLLAGSWPALSAALGAVAPEIAGLCAEAVRRHSAPPPALLAGSRRLPMDGPPLIVGILNATPDSFFDRGRYFGLDRALGRADEMAEEGADIIEVGGETAQGAVPIISADEEIDRVRPVIEAIAGRLSLPIGIDTHKPEVAAAAVECGATIVNDISGLADARMAEVAARSGAALVIMHIQGRPKVEIHSPQYARVVDEVYAFLAGRTARAEALGVPREALLVDPGLSFGKQPAHDVILVRRLREFRGLGLPIYLAASRKDFIRDLLDLPPDALLEGTMAVVSCGVLAGANLIRTHDVRAMRRLVAMLWTLIGPTPPVAAPAGER